MPRPPHLLVSISGHGFGHVAQTAPILNQLHTHVPDLRLTIRSAVPLAHLRSRIHAPFGHLPSEGDIGMVMSSALDVRVEDSRAAYRAFHTDWPRRVEMEARLLRELGVDMVFSNVGYLPLAGAQRAGIPNVALCSLNWHDIYHHYTGDDDIAGQILSCYAEADAFLRATPGMPMESLRNVRPVPPIAAVGQGRRGVLDRQLGLSPRDKLVLVSLGGIASRLPMEGWPRIEGVRWLVQAGWQVDRADAIAIESLPLSFSDLLCSCDAPLTKPGYGSFVEAVCSGTPVLYVDRPDWPETPALVAWLRQHGICREVPREQLEAGEIGDELAALWDMPAVAPLRPDGAVHVADWLAQRLSHPGD